jgi:2-polyprenyl-3-methyl-5-hydroxy-6-metoxy-1,4-benzoquinol methylase
MKGHEKTWSTPVINEEKKSVPCAVCGSSRFKPSLICEGFSYVRCVKCGLVQMNPQPLQHEIKRRYGEGSGQDYLAYELANEKAFLDLELLALNDAGFEKLEKELFANGIHANDIHVVRVLDVGCATGSLLDFLRQRGWETTGVEISKTMAEYGKRERKLNVREEPLEEIHFSDGYFNAVIASHLIEHLNDPASLVAEVYRILAIGGCFFVTTPNIAGFQARLFRGRWRSAIFDHLYLFSIKTLTRLLKEKGFAIEKIAVWGGLAKGSAPDKIKRLFDKAAKRFGFGDVMIIRAVKQ